MLRVALTHDVDRIRKSHQYITRFARHSTSFNFSEALKQIIDLKNKNQYWGFDKVINIEESFGVKSTFFFLNESIAFNILNPAEWQLSMGRYSIKEKKIIQMIEWLDKNGWEIGVHGSYLSYKDQNLLDVEKKELEGIVGHEIIGIRQHYLNLNDSTWNYQFNVGFKYDSSWGLLDEIGYKEGIIKPFNPLNNSFSVIPLTIMDICFVNTNNRWEELNELIESTIKNDSILVINWHTNNFYDLDFPNFKDYYKKIIEICLDKGAKFYTLSDYYEEISLVAPD